MGFSFPIESFPLTNKYPILSPSFEKHLPLTPPPNTACYCPLSLISFASKLLKAFCYSSPLPLLAFSLEPRPLNLFLVARDLCIVVFNESSSYISTIWHHGSLSPPQNTFFPWLLVYHSQSFCWEAHFQDPSLDVFQRLDVLTRTIRRAQSLDCFSLLSVFIL